MPAPQIVDAADAIESFVADIDRLRNMVVALELAAQAQDSDELCWPWLMESLRRMIPATTLLERAGDDLWRAARARQAEQSALSSHGALASASGAARGGAAKTTKRAGLAGAAARE